MSRIVATLATLFALLTPHETQALFHLAVIDEVKSGANGNPSIQYVEIRMLSTNQTLVAHSRLTVFKCSGDGGGSAVLIGDLPANVPNGGPNLRWIMASPSAAVFLAASGITPDFTWDATVIGSIPTACGMVCWGAPSSTGSAESSHLGRHQPGELHRLRRVRDLRRGARAGRKPARGRHAG